MTSSTTTISRHLKETPPTNNKNLSQKPSNNVTSSFIKAGEIPNPKEPPTPHVKSQN
jgi:hypothetical protein